MHQEMDQRLLAECDSRSVSGQRVSGQGSVATARRVGEMGRKFRQIQTANGSPSNSFDVVKNANCFSINLELFLFILRTV